MFFVMDARIEMGVLRGDDCHQIIYTIVYFKIVSEKWYQPWKLIVDQWYFALQFYSLMNYLTFVLWRISILDKSAKLT